MTRRQRNDVDDLIEQLFGGPPPFRDYGPGRPVHEPTEVFRVELPNGRGPFNSGLPNAHEIYDRIGTEHLERDNGGQCGLSDHEFAEAHDGEAEYGCDSLESLALWFPKGCRAYLKRLGARVVR